jgi:hypothetical protein
MKLTESTNIAATQILLDLANMEFVELNGMSRIVQSSDITVVPHVGQMVVPHQLEKDGVGSYGRHYQSVYSAQGMPKLFRHFIYGSTHIDLYFDCKCGPSYAAGNLGQILPSQFGCVCST